MANGTITPNELHTIGLSQHLHQFQVHKRISLGKKQHHQCSHILKDQGEEPCQANFPTTLSTLPLTLPQKQISHPALVLVAHTFQFSHLPFFSASMQKPIIANACSLLQQKADNVLGFTI